MYYNCHVINTHYASWQHNSHRDAASCVDCPQPRDSFVDKMSAKVRDGLKHSVAMTFGTYDNNIRITDDVARRIQANCISCHQDVLSEMMKYTHLYQPEGNGAFTRNLLGLS